MKARSILSIFVLTSCLALSVAPVIAEESKVAVSAASAVKLEALADVKADVKNEVNAVTVPASAVKVETSAPAETQAAPAKNPFNGTFWALIPPLVAIILALITKEVYSSLFIGLLLGSCFVAEFKPLVVVDTAINAGLIDAIKSTAGIFIFLIILGVFVSLINKTGATDAFGNWAKIHVKSRIGAILCTFLLGIMIFIDDYFNCLTVGSVMRPVTDSKNVSRAKLAYIIDSTAAPICMIAPISSWAAAVSQYAQGGDQAATNYSGLELFCRSIPFNFYSLLTFVFVIAITLMKFDFGPMALHERSAMRVMSKEPKISEADIIQNDRKRRGRIIDMVLPILLLIGICVFALVYVGGILNGVPFIEAFGATDATVGLPWGALIALVLTIIYLVARKVVTFQKAMLCIPRGFVAMVPAMLILTFAVSLKNITGVLGAKEYIGLLMQGAASDLVNYLPAVIFVVACVLAFSTGTSWGTFGILIPIVTSIFTDPGSPLLYIGMSACLAGAVCGDHCSPISDTTIMASAGAHCKHLKHVSTQLPYALTVAVFSFLGFLLSGIVAGSNKTMAETWYIVFPTMVIMMIVILFLLRYLTQKKMTSADNAA